MLRILTLPVAVVAVLASTACASGGGVEQTAPATTGASAEPEQAEASTAAPAEVAETAPGEPAGAAESSSAAAGIRGDPGVPGLPESSGASIDDVLRLGAVATWMERPERIALSLPASSSCWALAGSPVVESSTRIRVHVEQPEPCEGADAARTYAISVPSGVDTSRELELAVEGLEHEFTLALPAR